MYHSKKIDDYESINSVNALYLIIGKADGYVEENNGNKYLVFTSTDGYKNVLAKFRKLCDEMKVKKASIKKISRNSNLIQMIIYP